MKAETLWRESHQWLSARGPTKSRWQGRDSASYRGAGTGFGWASDQEQGQDSAGPLNEELGPTWPGLRPRNGNWCQSGLRLGNRNWC